MSPFIDNFNPLDYLVISKEIESGVNNRTSISTYSRDPAWLRSAISRAYYSAFLALRDEFLNDPRFRPLIKGVAGDHTAIKNKLQTLPQNLFYLATSLESLRGFRNNADYDPPTIFSVTPQITQIANIMADDIIQNVRIIMSNIS